MKLETIIEVLGNRIGKKLILLRQSLPHSTFKLYSTYRLELHERVGRKTNKVLEYEEVYKMNNDKALDNIEKEFLKRLFDVYIQ